MKGLLFYNAEIRKGQVFFEVKKIIVPSNKPTHKFVKGKFVKINVLPITKKVKKNGAVLSPRSSKNILSIKKREGK